MAEEFGGAKEEAPGETGANASGADAGGAASLGSLASLGMNVRQVAG